MVLEARALGNLGMVHQYLQRYPASIVCLRDGIRLATHFERAWSSTAAAAASAASTGEAKGGPDATVAGVGVGDGVGVGVGTVAAVGAGAPVAAPAAGNPNANLWPALKLGDLALKMLNRLVWACKAAGRFGDAELYCKQMLAQVERKHQAQHQPRPNGNNNNGSGGGGGNDPVADLRARVAELAQLRRDADERATAAAERVAAECK